MLVPITYSTSNVAWFSNVAFLSVFVLAIGGESSQSPNHDLIPTNGLSTIRTGSLLAPNRSGLNVQCGVTVQTNSNSDDSDRCPASCPYWAQNRDDAMRCSFVCVSADDCGKLNTDQPIPDTIKKSRTCRGPRVRFCSEMNLDGTDSCRRCQSGFELHLDDGACYFRYWGCLMVGALLLGVCLAILIVWVLDLSFRKPINEQELDEALQWRARSKILQPKQANGVRHVYPWNTNLCKEDVAGPGMTLHFNFQAFVILWALFVAVVWTVLASFHKELFVLGTQRFGTPRHNCIMVAWGCETEQRLSWAKVLFLVIVYMVTFISCLVFAAYQNHLYKRMDAEDKTYKDFAVELRGLPKLPADHKDVEKIILDAVNRATGKAPIGVSVGWDFSQCQDEVFQAVEESRGVVPAGTKALLDAPPVELGTIRKKMYKVESSLFGPCEPKTVQPLELLMNMTSSDCAYVIFASEDQKDEVLESTPEITFDPRACLPGAEECCLTVKEVPYEPAAINWKYFGDSSPQIMTNRAMWNFSTLYLPALAVWFFVFYVPYAASTLNFNYENGAELPAYYGLVFTMIVVGGNLTMYVICDMCAERMCFRYKDTKQVAYVLMYLFACAINVLLDLVVTYFTSQKILIGLDLRTHDGVQVSDIGSSIEEFETYPMQRLLAENIYAYSFPSTFLIPFLLEPFARILVPLWIAGLLIRTHRGIHGMVAEKLIAAENFDMGRYADILLNVFLGILIFYFPGGYTWSLFYAMVFSHIVIYIFDHWRVLNVIPYVKCTSPDVDWWAQLMLIPCTSLILSCAVFKANCEPNAGYCLKDLHLISVTALAGVAHLIVHSVLFIYIVPAMISDVENKTMHLQYEDVAASDAHSWFAVNLVHCLRSHYIHEHSPYCRFASVGKEHLLEINEEIGCYFKDEPAMTETFSVSGEFQAFRKYSASFVT